jgi:hypothetical protein
MVLVFRFWLKVDRLFPCYVFRWHCALLCDHTNTWPLTTQIHDRSPHKYMTAHHTNTWPLTIQSWYWHVRKWDCSTSSMGPNCPVIVRFVDIGGIVYHHCLHVLFIILQKSTDNKFENTPKRVYFFHLDSNYKNYFNKSWIGHQGWTL